MTPTLGEDMNAWPFSEREKVGAMGRSRRPAVYTSPSGRSTCGSNAVAKLVSIQIVNFVLQIS